MKPGTRVELVYTNDEYTMLRPGDKGTVTEVDDHTSSLGFTQVWVKWDDGSFLAMVPESGDVIKEAK